jgi:penicillin-binding protein 1C
MNLRLNKRKKEITVILLITAVAAGAIIWKTNADLLPLPTYLSPDGSNVRKVQVLDRNYLPLTVTYLNRWNIHSPIFLHDIPQFLQQALVVSEDQRFYRHQGVD